jgi:hypothetical protein
MATPPSRITKIGGDIRPLKGFVICKTETPSCFSCKIDILWFVPFLQNRGDVSALSDCHTMNKALNVNLRSSTNTLSTRFWNAPKQTTSFWELIKNIESPALSSKTGRQMEAEILCDIDS